MQLQTDFTEIRIKVGFRLSGPQVMAQLRFGFYGHLRTVRLRILARPGRKRSTLAHGLATTRRRNDGPVHGANSFSSCATIFAFFVSSSTSAGFSFAAI